MLFVNDSNFESEVLQSEKPVMVDFYAAWCGPCKMITPFLEEISEEMEDEVKICKLDIDESIDIAQKYGVISIPTLIMFRDGKEVAKKVGALPKPEIEEFINSNL